MVPGIHPASYSMGTRDHFPGGNGLLTLGELTLTSLHPEPMLRIVELYL